MHPPALSILVRHFVLLAALFTFLSPSPHAAEPKEGEKKGKPNRLAKESSPYLLQHAYNPVDWRPWGPEAFEAAAKEKKVVFLSIGYSSCHWCHVMERESFSNQEVADILNKNFICIKVDREERPDVDDIYMTALHTMGARGGWPLSMFLTPDGKPIVGGTYWPREDRKEGDETFAGFKTVLGKIMDIWKEKPKEIQEQANSYAEATIDALSRNVRANPIVALDRDLAKGAALMMSEEIDPVHGGIGRKANNFRGTKFPMPSSAIVLLDHAVREKDDDLKKLVVLTLDKMAQGGIYDQIGGGFHRYSTERHWTVPHFEKMLYDNAQLVEFYADAYRHWKKEDYARIIRETLTFIGRELTSPEGGFYSALDADSNGVEGEFYVWTPQEIEKILGNKEDAEFLKDVYGVNGTPNFEEKFFILRLKKPLDEIAKDKKLSTEEFNKKLTALNQKLMDVRAKRVRPFLDTKILTAWNGQMIAGYAKAGEVLKNPEYTKTAIRAAEFILKNMRTKDGRLLRSYGKNAEGKLEAKLNGYLDDYAFLTHGLLNLHDATGDKRWLDEAKSLTDTMLKWYGDGEKGGYYYTSSDHEKLFARPKEYYDNAQPSANGVTVRNLVRLAHKTKEDNYRALAEKSFRQFAGVIRANPSGVPSMCLALHSYLDAKDAAPEPKKKDESPTTVKETTEDLVKLTATTAPGAKGKQVITVKMTIAEPWHIYANPVENQQFATAATTVSIRANGKLIEGQIDYPKGTVEKYESYEYRVYEKEVTITATIPETPGPLEVSAKVQTCKKGLCLLPTTLKTTIK